MKATPCSFHLRVNRYKEIRCSHQIYDDQGCCIFHSERIEKVRDFHIELSKLVAQFASEESSACYEFAGFVFPSVTFNAMEFDKPVYFQSARFKGHADFSGCKFQKEVDFFNAVFEGGVVFANGKFEGKGKFEYCHFKNRVTFSSCRFLDRALFGKTTFLRAAHFGLVQFKGFASFAGCRFFGGTSFSKSIFTDTATFGGSSFWKRADFKDTIFSNEIILRGSKVDFLKDPPSSKMNLDGVILKAVHFAENRRLEDYSFRDAFLLSLNLAEKELVNCNFTGAVFKAVLTQGWTLDDKTIAETKYIYTDYRFRTVTEEDGTLTEVYEQVEESRVPADGLFGIGEHANFTIREYLNEPLKWTFALSVPPQFRTAVLNYIQFFTDFMNITEGVAVEIRTRQEGRKLRIEFMTNSSGDKELVQERFEQYRQNTTKDFTALDIHFNSSVSEVEKELFRIRYEHTMNTLRTELTYTQRLLKKEEEKNALQDIYLSLLRQANIIPKEPARLLTPPRFGSLRQSKTPVFFLTADLKDYSKATLKDRTLYPAIQAFLFDQKDLIASDSACEAVKLEGDAIKVFFKDGLKLIWIAKNLISNFENHKYAQPSSISGFRVVLGYGVCYREQRGTEVDYSGEAIVHTCRIDQPMKEYIENHYEKPNQIWCTQSFRDEVSGQHPNVTFEELPPINLDKGYPVNTPVFRVEVH